MGRISIVFILVCVLFSCKKPSPLYFDISNDCLRRCDGRSFRFFQVLEQNRGSQGDNLSIRVLKDLKCLDLSDIKGSEFEIILNKRIKISKIERMENKNKNFGNTSSFHGSIDTLDKITLNPNSKYLLKTYFGSRSHSPGEYSLFIETNDKGKVINPDKTSCE